MPPRVLGIALILIGLLAGTACSKSSTSQASSESSSNSSASSSGSSSGPSAYVRDVRDYTREWVLSGGELSGFQREIAKIAQKRGISDWEQDEETYLGIGRGLKKAGIRGQRYEMLRSQLAGTNADSGKWIQAGYDKEKVD